MYAQLGDVIFSGVVAFNELTRAKKSRVAEIPLLDGTSRLQKTGDELVNISFSITLDRSFSDPDEMVSMLDRYRDDGSILDLSDGTGILIGQFVLISTNEAWRQLRPDGTLQTIVISVELKQYVDPNPVATSILAAEQTAFALEQNQPARVEILERIPTPMAEVSAATIVARSGSDRAQGLVQKSVDLPTQLENLFLQVKGIVAQVQSDCQTAIDNLQNIAGLAAKAPDLLEKTEAVQDNAAALESSVTSGDLTNALINADLLIQSSGEMATANLPLDLILITRAPQ